MKFAKYIVIFESAISQRDNGDVVMWFWWDMVMWFLCEVVMWLWWDVVMWFLCEVVMWPRYDPSSGYSELAVLS